MKNILIATTNADKFDENTNTGTWILNKDTENKVIEFKLQKENGSQKEEEQEEKTNNNDKKSSFNFMYVLIGAGIFGIILVVVLLYGVTLNKKRNKL